MKVKVTIHSQFTFNKVSDQIIVYYGHNLFIRFVQKHNLSLALYRKKKLFKNFMFKQFFLFTPGVLRINVPKLQSPINIPDHSPHVLRTELVVDYYSYFLTIVNIVITTS